VPPLVTKIISPLRSKSLGFSNRRIFVFPGRKQPRAVGHARESRYWIRNVNSDGPSGLRWIILHLENDRACHFRKLRPVGPILSDGRRHQQREQSHRKETLHGRARELISRSISESIVTRRDTKKTLSYGPWAFFNHGGYFYSQRKLLAPPHRCWQKQQRPLDGRVARYRPSPSCASSCLAFARQPWQLFPKSPAQFDRRPSSHFFPRHRESECTKSFRSRRRRRNTCLRLAP